MTANVVHPAELERMLQARVTEARSKRPAARRPQARSGQRRARRGSVALIAGAMLALSAAAAWASHGSDIIDLTGDGDQVIHNDSIFTQGGLGAGTGNFDPYLTLSPGGSARDLTLWFTVDRIDALYRLLKQRQLRAAQAGESAETLEVRFERTSTNPSTAAGSSASVT